MTTLLFFIGILVFLICWWWRTNKKKTIINHQGIDVQSGKTLKPFKKLQNEDLSDFQKWILEYEEIDNPEGLEDNLRIAYDNDDWKLLEASVYKKWSQFKWGI